MGVWKSSWAGDLLAPVDMDFAHARFPALRSQTGGTSHGEFALACGQCVASFHLVAAADRRDLAERVRRCDFRRPPFAGRYGGVGDGTEKSAERVFLAARSARLCQ